MKIVLVILLLAIIYISLLAKKKREALKGRNIITVGEVKRSPRLLKPNKE